MLKGWKKMRYQKEFWSTTNEKWKTNKSMD
jgi:hypothetical protein